MPKRNYVQAKKEIEALMLEDVDCVAEFGISKWSDVWDSSFETKNILEEGKVIDFTYSEKALSIQKTLNEGVEKAIDVAKSIDTPEFFDYLLGEVKIEGNFKTYNKKHVQSNKKYFNISQKNKKAYYTSLLLLKLVNIAPDGSQASTVRKNAKELTVLSFAGVHRDTKGVHACVFDFKNINNFKSLEKLEIYCPSGILNSKEITNLTQLSDFAIEGSILSNKNTHEDNRIIKNQLFINENFPDHPNLSTIKIGTASNRDLTFLKSLQGLSIISIFNCAYLCSIKGINVKEIRTLAINGCDQLSDISLIKEAGKIEEIVLNLNSENIRISELKGLKSCKKLWVFLSKEVDVSFIEKLENIEDLSINGGDFSKVKNLAALEKMKDLAISSSSLKVHPDLGNNLSIKRLTISSPNLNKFEGISNCSNLKMISLSVKSLKSITNFPKLKIVDISFGRDCSLESLGFLENTQIITKYNSSLGYNEETGIKEGDFHVSSNRSDEDKKKTGKNLPDGFDSNGYVIPEIYDDGSSTDFLSDNKLNLSMFKNLENLNGLKNVTNIMALDLSNCVKLTSIEGIEKMLDLREIDLTGCTKLETINSLKHCSKLERIITLNCNNIIPKPKLKKMVTLEKVQDYLKRL
jgi:hypothetical protein